MPSFRKASLAPPSPPSPSSRSSAESRSASKAIPRAHARAPSRNGTIGDALEALARGESAAGLGEVLHAWALSAAARLRDVGQRAIAAPPRGDRATHVVLLAERGDEHRRAQIVLRVDDAQLELSVEMPVLDAHALRPAELAALLALLPEQFHLGPNGDQAASPACSASTEELRALLSRAERDGHRPWLGWRIPRALALEHASTLDDELKDAVVALASVVAGPGAPGAGRKRARRSSPSRRREVMASPPLEPGTEVRVLQGPFCGKVGVVQALDSKGGVRVLLGLLAVKVDVADLARCTEGRRRPVLPTSHRKPSPVRS